MDIKNYILMQDKEIISFLCELDLQEKKLSKKFNKCVEILYNRWYNKMYRYALSRGLNDDEAISLITDSFLIVIKNIHDYKPTYHFSSWLYGIMHNKVLQLYQTKKIEEISLDEVNSDNISLHEIIADKAINIESDFIDKTIKNELLNRLDHRERKVINLLFDERLSPEDVAVILKTTADNIRHIKKRALDRLRVITADEYQGND